MYCNRKSYRPESGLWCFAMCQILFEHANEALLVQYPAARAMFQNGRCHSDCNNPPIAVNGVGVQSIFLSPRLTYCTRKQVLYRARQSKTGKAASAKSQHRTQNCFGRNCASARSLQHHHPPKFLLVSFSWSAFEAAADNSIVFRKMTTQVTKCWHHFCEVSRKLDGFA